MQSIHVALAGARANPFDISGRPQASSSSSSSISTSRIPSMREGLEQIQTSRSDLIQEIQAKKSTLTRQTLADDVSTAQTAIANLTPKGQEVFKALLLNIVRDAALTHRIDHSQNIPEVESGIGQVGAARSKQAVPVGTLDRTQQAAILQTVLHQAPNAQFSVEWGQVALRQVHPTHLSTIFVEMGSQHTYKDIFESLKDMKQDLKVPLHVLVHAASQPSEEGVENAFKDALGANFNLQEQVQRDAFKRLKAVSLLMQVLGCVVSLSEQNNN